MSAPHGGSRPTSLPSNPGQGPTVEMGFSNSERSWEEEANLVEILAKVLEDREFLVSSHEGTWIEHTASGFVFLPQFVGLVPLDRGGVRTTTTIQVHHPTLIPEGLFEYQHSFGVDAVDSFRKGFEQWAQVDLVTLLDAARPRPEACMMMVMTLPEEAGRPALKRRAILGPIAHYQEKPPSEAEAAEEGHSYCPCCLVTRSFEAFKDLFTADKFFGLRLFALRDNEGEHLADCRLNGDDFEPGMIALKNYAATWPQAGYEFRKQYVILQTIDHDMEEPADGAGDE